MNAARNDVRNSVSGCVTNIVPTRPDQTRPELFSYVLGLDGQVCMASAATRGVDAMRGASQ